MHYVTTVYIAAFLAILFVTLTGYICSNINVSEYFRCTFVVILIQSIFIGYVAKQGVAGRSIIYGCQYSVLRACTDHVYSSGHLYPTGLR
jgi:hypothetical protein